VIILILPVLMGLIIGAVVVATLRRSPGLGAGCLVASIASSLTSARKARQAEPVELPSFGYLRLKAA